MRKRAPLPEGAGQKVRSRTIRTHQQQVSLTILQVTKPFKRQQIAIIASQAKQDSRQSKKENAGNAGDVSTHTIMPTQRYSLNTTAPAINATPVSQLSPLNPPVAPHAIAPHTQSGLSTCSTQKSTRTSLPLRSWTPTSRQAASPPPAPRPPKTVEKLV